MAEALVIIDYQNDFNPPDGALAVAGGDQIVGRLNQLAGEDRFAYVVATRDWHPPDHSQFAERGGPWPVHCVQGTPGAELHPELDRSRLDLVLDKGEDPEWDGYSAFEAGDLARILREKGVDRLTVVGLATDVCVRNSALDALGEGFGVEVLRDATRGVDPDDSEAALEEIEAAGGTVR